MTSVRRLQKMCGPQRATSWSRNGHDNILIRLGIVWFGLCWSVLVKAEAADPPIFGQVDPAAVSRGPWHDVSLTTGERWQAECLRVDVEAIELRWRGSVRWRVPKGVVHSLSSPPGMREVAFHSFNDPATDTGMWTSSHSPAWESPGVEAILAGSWSAWRRVTGSPEQNHGATVTLLFLRNEQSVELTLRLLGNGQIETEVPTDWSPTYRQNVRLATGWEKLRVTWDSRSCRLSAGEQLLNEWACNGLRYVGCRLTSSADTSAKNAIELDDVAVQAHEQTVPQVALPLPLTDDCVTFWSGDQLFGRVTIDRNRTILLKGRQATWSGSWADVFRIDFAPAKILEWGLSPVQGWCFDARTDPLQATGGLSEVWRGCAWRPDGFDHPLGRIWINPQSRPQPQVWLGLGEWSWLHTGTRRLDSDTADQPLRRLASGSWSSNQPGSGWVTIDVQGLSPGGPGTPASEPMQEALRRGDWRTELSWNGRVISDLNHRLWGQYPLFERVWIPVPHIKAGENAWHLQQQPARFDNHRYDDGQLGPIGLWRPIRWP